VRIGTGGNLPAGRGSARVVESLVIGQDWPPGEVGDVRVILFVRLREGMTLDKELAERIKQKIRANTTPRHVPAKIVQVTDIRARKATRSSELAVRNIVHGAADQEHRGARESRGTRGSSATANELKTERGSDEHAMNVIASSPRSGSSSGGVPVARRARALFHPIRASGRAQAQLAGRRSTR
jgi:hypothetical protein